MATPMANSNGRLAKIALPAAAMTCETPAGSQEKLALPTPSRMPATGSTETGSIIDLPTFCRTENAFLKSAMSGLAVVGVGFGLGVGIGDERAHFGGGIRGQRE